MKKIIKQYLNYRLHKYCLRKSIQYGKTRKECDHDDIVVRALRILYFMRGHITLDGYEELES